MTPAALETAMSIDLDVLEAMAKALEPFSWLEIPKRTVGNAGAYSILHDHIRTARTALSAHRTLGDRHDD